MTTETSTIGDEAAAWRARAIDCALFTAELATRYDARLPEHFDAHWTPDPEANRYLDWYRRWWRYAEQYLIDRDHGSWRHELDVANRPGAEVWPGKPDLYHAVQATLIPRAPLATSVANAVAEGLE